MTRSAYILAARRTSVAPVGGAFRDLDYDALAEAPIRACLAQAGIEPARVDELVLSNGLGAGGNPARVALLRAGLPLRVAGLSLDRQCVGGLDAVLLAASMVRAGAAEAVLAGGSDSSSLRPERAYKSRWADAPQMREQARFTPWPERDPDMTDAAARLAGELGISRARQDSYAIESHRKARAAQAGLQAEIANPKGVDLDGDPFTRRLNENLCSRARPLAGGITSANAAVSADGAAFVLVVSKQVAERLQPQFALRLIGGLTRGGDPERPGLAPVEAIEKVLRDAATSVGQLQAIELMEAYAAQAIACIDGAKLPPHLVNRSGGALARGHPIGASGAVLMVRLFDELQRTPGPGLAAIAGAGGLGAAILLESV